MYLRLVIFQSFSFFFLLLEDYKESLIGEYCENIMFEERCELIIEEILFLSASTTGSKLHKVYTVSVRRQASYHTEVNRHVTVRILQNTIVTY